MKIIRVEAWPVKLVLSEPYRIAYQTVEATTNVFVRIVTDGSLVGHGCAAPDEAIIGESAESTLEAIMAVVEPVFVYADLDGHLGLVGDPAAGAVRLDRGTLVPSDLPGLGVDLDG